MAPVPDQPPAVTTITPEELEAAGVDNTRDLSALAPNLVVQEAGDRKSSFIGMRGRTNAAAFSDSNVGLYVDGVPTSTRGARS